MQSGMLVDSMYLKVHLTRDILQILGNLSREKGVERAAINVVIFVTFWMV